MRRYITTTLIVLCTLLFMGVTVIWIRSYWITDAWAYQRLHVGHQQQVLIGYRSWSCRGTLGVSRVAYGHRGDASEVEAWQHAYRYIHWQGTDYWHPGWVAPHSLFQSLTCFRIHSVVDNTIPEESARIVLVTLPLWVITALCAAPIGVSSLRTLRNRRRLVKGLCLACGYDLRATPDHCPECGERAEQGRK